MNKKRQVDLLPLVFLYLWKLKFDSEFTHHAFLTVREIGNRLLNWMINSFVIWNCGNYHKIICRGYIPTEEIPY